MHYINTKRLVQLLKSDDTADIEVIHEYLDNSKMNSYIWKDINMYKVLTSEMITRYKDRLEWDMISIYSNLEESTMCNFERNLNWSSISEHQTLSEDFIRKFQNRLDWYYICEYQTLSEDFIKEFSTKVNWMYISHYQILTEAFIEEFKYILDWRGICERQVLSEDFIIRLKEYVDWECVSRCQILSESFIQEFKEYLYINTIIKYQKLSGIFLRELVGCRNHREHPIYANSIDILYKNNAVVNKFEKDIYGYKVLTRSMNSIYYNTKYELNKETPYINCDTSLINNCSFGYNFYLKVPDIINYNDRVLVKVLIKREDIGVILNSSNIGRCYKLTPIEIING